MSICTSALDPDNVSSKSARLGSPSLIDSLKIFIMLLPCAKS